MNNSEEKCVWGERRIRIQRLLNYFNFALIHNGLQTDSACVGSNWMCIPPVTEEEYAQAVKDNKLTDNNSHRKFAFFNLQFFELKEAPAEMLVFGRICDRGE